MNLTFGANCSTHRIAHKNKVNAKLFQEKSFPKPASSSFLESRHEFTGVGAAQMMRS